MSNTGYREWHVWVECPMRHRLTASLSNLARYLEGVSGMTCPVCDNDVQQASLKLEAELADGAE